MRDYESHFNELSKKCKSKIFLKGLAEIKDPSTWPVKGQFDDYSEQVAMGGVDVVDEQPSSKRRKSGGAGGEGSEKKKRKKAEVYITWLLMGILSLAILQTIWSSN